MNLLDKLKCKNLTFILDQFVKLEKLEEITLKLEFAKIIKNHKICFFQTTVCKGGFQLISDRKISWETGNIAFWSVSRKKKIEKKVEQFNLFYFARKKNNSTLSCFLFS